MAKESKINEISVSIDSNKVYCSYYAKACKILTNKRMVSISIGIPDNFGGSILRELNPPEYLLRGYKNGLYNDKEYEEIYTKEVLDKLDVEDIYNKIKGKVILCYCGSDKFCHRHLVIKWIKDNKGEEFVGGEI